MTSEYGTCVTASHVISSGIEEKGRDGKAAFLWYAGFLRAWICRIDFDEHGA